VTKLWDVATREQIANLETIHRSRAIAFSPDGRTLYSIGNGGNVTLWDVATHNEIAILPGRGRGFGTAMALSPDGTLLAAHDSGIRLWGLPASSVEGPTAVDPRGKAGSTWARVKLGALASKETAFLPNYPNPFNPDTWIPFDLQDAADVRITVHDVDGRVVRSLDGGHRPAGTYRTRGRAAHWDGRNEHGETVSSGVYFVEMLAGGRRITRRVALRK